MTTPPAPAGDGTPLHPPGPSHADPFDAGPYARLQAALRLPSPAAREAGWRRALAAAAVAWVPLLLLSAAQGLALGPGPRESFLLDVPAHVRYLVAIPAFVAAEPWCLPRLALIARHFVRSGLVAGDDRARLDALVASARRRLDHRGMEVVLAVAVYAATVVTSGFLYPLGTPSWVAPGVEGTPAALSLAGWWRTLVSHPLFLLLLAAWLWRVAVWWRFLWGVSRLRLRLVPAHPDLAAGLRFVAGSLGAFAPVGLALGTVAAGTLAEGVLRGTRTLWALDHLGAVAAALVAVLCAFVGPLFAFAGPLRRARLHGTMEYGALAGALGRCFEDRWLRSGKPLRPEALQEPDFSAVTDLYSIAANVRQMSLAPVGLRDLAPLVVATVIPFVPVVLLTIPVDELLARLAKLFL